MERRSRDNGPEYAGDVAGGFRMTRRILMAAALLAVIHDARAEDRVVVADFSSAVAAGETPAGWELSERSGEAELAVLKDGGVSAIRLRSVNTSFSIQKEVKVDLEAFPVLTWNWKVTKLPVGGDFRKSATDDQAAQLFVAFSKSKAIVYVWSSTVPKGIMQSTSPAPFMTVMVVVVRSGPAQAGKWVRESRNVRQDYKKLFGSEPPPVSGMRLQINSQHTGTSAESYFADVAFANPGKQRAKAQVPAPK
jgi:hypothetical protein